MRTNVRTLGWILKDVFTSWVMKKVGIILTVFIAGWILLVPSLWVSQEVNSHIPMVGEMMGEAEFIDDEFAGVDALSTNEYGRIFALSYSSPKRMLGASILGICSVIRMLVPLIIIFVALVCIAIVYGIILGIFTFTKFIASGNMRWTWQEYIRTVKK